MFRKLFVGAVPLLASAAVALALGSDTARAVPVEEVKLVRADEWLEVNAVGCYRHHHHHHGHYHHHHHGHYHYGHYHYHHHHGHYHHRHHSYHR
jgi:hypothetical protein